MLTIGDHGEAVRELQQQLLTLGYTLGRAGADGRFGPATAAAVQAFQQAHGLTADGVVGPMTEAALATALAPVPPAPLPLSLTVPNGLAEIRATFGDIQLVAGPDSSAPCYLRVLGDWAASSLAFAHPEGIPSLSRIYCHRKLVAVIEAAFADIAGAGLAAAVHSFDGCFCPRYKRRTQKQLPSVHCWGIALDLNAATNRQGTKGDMSPQVVAVFRRHGFKWGGDWAGRYRDPMHFQYCTGY